MGFQLFLIFEKILMYFSPTTRKTIFVLLSSLAYIFSRNSKKRVKQNLQFIFQDNISKDEINNITKYSLKNLSLNLLHLMEIRSMKKEDLAKKVTIQNKKIIDDIHKEGRAVIYVTTHYSSWELGGATIGAFIEPLGAVYKKMKNKNYENWVLESRSHFGNINLEKTNVIKPLIKLLKEKKGCGILIDTKINKKDGVLVNFLGKKIYQTPTPAYLARKFNAAIVPVAMRTDDDEHYTLMIFDEIKVEKTEDAKADIQKATQKQADWLSELIYKEPKFWFWLHKRFKGEYPEVYK